MVGGALAGIPTVLFALGHSLTAGIVTAIAFIAYQQIENHVLNPMVMSRTRSGTCISIRYSADVTLATFFVSHLTPFGSATGTLVNASTLETEGIAAATTGEAIALISLTSTIALIVLFGTEFAATAGRHVSHQYLVIAGVAVFLVVVVLALVLAVGAHPAVAGQAGRWAASVARHVRPGIDPEKVAETSRRLASLARSALTGRPFLTSFGFAAGDLLFDLLSLDLVFLALRYQPGFGPLAVAYGAANIASAIPVTPGGLGVIEVTMVAITVGFGAPRATAVLAVLGYRIVNYWLPLIPGAIAYLRLRLRPGADGKRKDKGKPAAPQAG
jgi:hypothetical protein